MQPLLSYQVGGNLPIDAPTYVKRKADHDFYQGLKAGEFCYILNSRQMGKSSLRVQAMHRLQAEGVACAVIDLTTIGIEQITPEQWYASLIGSLVSSFKLKLNLVTWWRDRHLLSPVQRWSNFIEEVLLHQIQTQTVIFIDEIDSVLSLHFPVEDFFAAIRACYNQRAENSAYQRLTFSLLGVATPSDLMQDKQRTPFNIGCAIDLTGFQLHEAGILAQGFVGVANPIATLQAILYWTGGQPFLTQKLCRLVAQENRENIDQLVRSHLLENWEFHDEPTHLKTIRDRLLSNPQRAGKRLGLYQQLLNQPIQNPKFPPLGILTDDSPEQMELRLSGLVVERQGRLTVHNPVYAAIFNSDWVQKVLARLCPYSEALAAWVAADRDESWLLRGHALQEAQIWATDKSLSDRDYWFLDASRELEKRQVERALVAEKRAKEVAEQANQILTEARQKAELALEEERKANQRLAKTQWKARWVARIGFVMVALLAIAAITVSLEARNLMQHAEAKRRAAEISSLNASSQLMLLKNDQLGALIASIKAGQQLVNPISLETTSNRTKRISEIEQPYVDRLLDKENLTAQTTDALQLAIYSIHELNRLQGHQDKINSVAFSSDGELIASASDDATIKLWKRDGSLLKTLSCQANQFLIQRCSAFNSVSFSPDSQTIMAADQAGKIKLWSRKGELVQVINAHKQGIENITISPNGEVIASGSWDNTIKLWKNNGEAIQTKRLIRHQGAVYSVSFSPDSQTFASAGEHGDIKLWNLDGDELKQWTAHTHQINSLSFSPDGQTLVSASSDGTAKLWKRQGTLLKTFVSKNGQIYSVAFSPDGATLATAYQDGTVKLWRTQDASEIGIFQGHKGAVYGVSFSPDGQLASGSYDNTVRLWRVNNPLRQDLKAHTAEVNSVSFSPDGQFLASAGQDGTVKLWRSGFEANPSKSHLLSPTFLRTLTTHSNWFQAVSFSPDGEAIAAASRDWTVKLWNRNGVQLRTLKGHKGRVYDVRFSPDSATIASAGYDATIKLWNRQGELVKTLKGHKGRVYSVRFSPNGQQLASAGGDETVRVWSREGQLLSTLKGHRGRVYGIAFSPDGQTIASVGNDGTLKLWNLHDDPSEELGSSRRLTTFQSDGVIYSISFSPDGQIIATGNQDGTVKLWDLNGYLIQSLRGHGGVVESVSFSPTGDRILASASRDKTVILWQWNLNLKDLLHHSCDWLQDYLQNNPTVAKGDRTLCQRL